MTNLFKKTDVKLDLLTDYNMLLIVEKGIRGGMCQYTQRCAKQIINSWKIVIKVLSHHI